MTTTETFLVLAAFVLLHFVQIQAEICINGDFCPPPKSCCQVGRCCVWTDGQQSSSESINYPYGGYYKLNIWDMWYFWILVILIILSCFGGCGYWWRRQILIYTRSTPFYTSSNQHSCRYHHRQQWSRTSNSTETSTGDEDSHDGFSNTNSPYRGSPSSYYGAYYYPQRNVIQQPPLYSEVTAKPDLYPVIEESARDSAKSPTSVENDLIISKFMTSGVVCTESPSSSTYSTNQSSVFLPPPYSESDVSAPYTSSYPASNISTPGSMISYSTNSDVMFLNSHVHHDSLPHSSILYRPCLSSPPLATSPTSEQMPSQTNFSPLMNRSNHERRTEVNQAAEEHSPTNSLSLALSRLEQNVSAIIRHSERHDQAQPDTADDIRAISLRSDATLFDQVPSSSCQIDNCAENALIDISPADSASSTGPNKRSYSSITSNRRSSLGNARNDSLNSPPEGTVSRTRSLRYGRRGILIRTKSDDPEDSRIAANETTILIRSSYN